MALRDFCNSDSNCKQFSAETKEDSIEQCMIDKTKSAVQVGVHVKLSMPCACHMQSYTLCSRCCHVQGVHCWLAM